MGPRLGRQRGRGRSPQARGAGACLWREHGVTSDLIAVLPPAFAPKAAQRAAAAAAPPAAPAVAASSAAAAAAASAASASATAAAAADTAAEATAAAAADDADASCGRVSRATEGRSPRTAGALACPSGEASPQPPVGTAGAPAPPAPLAAAARAAPSRQYEPAVRTAPPPARVVRAESARSEASRASRSRSSRSSVSRPCSWRPWAWACWFAGPLCAPTARRPLLSSTLLHSTLLSKLLPAQPAASLRVPCSSRGCSPVRATTRRHEASSGAAPPDPRAGAARFAGRPQHASAAGPRPYAVVGASPVRAKPFRGVREPVASALPALGEKTGRFPSK